MTIANLTPEFVARLTEPGLFWDQELKGFGCLCRRDARGNLARSFIIQYRVGKQQRKLKLGDAAKLTVKQARKKAEELFARITLGQDPQGERKQERAAPTLTFADAVGQYLTLKKLSVRHSSLRVTTLYLTHPRYFPFGKMPLDKITQSQVASRLDAIHAESGAPTCSRSRAHLSAFFTWSMRRGHCALNPVIATEAIKSGPGRERILSDDELRIVWNSCRDDDLGRVIKLLLLSGLRASEVGGLRWSEIHDGAIHLPPKRTKSGRAHVVPLTPMMRSVIDSTPKMLHRDCLFGERTDTGFTSWGKLKRLGDGISERWTPHDLRRTFRTGLGRLGIPPHIAELCIAHRKPSNVVPLKQPRSIHGPGAPLKQEAYGRDQFVGGSQSPSDES
jgi:integrase